jgi:cell division protein ZipA
MDNLRWILLIVGLGLVLGIYLFSLYQNRRDDLPRRRKPRREAPLLEDEIDDTAGFDYDDELEDVVNQVGEIYAGDEPGYDPLFDEPPPADTRKVTVAAAAPEPEVPQSPDKVFTLYVMAPRGVPFRGPVLLGALADAGLEFGDMQIFHRTAMVNGQEKILFSAANIKEPGIFDLSAMDNFTTEGIVLFFQVPGGVDGAQAFDAMVESARIIASDLDSTVCDATRSVLTNQTISHMREEVISYQLQQRVANTAS